MKRLMTGLSILLAGCAMNFSKPGASTQEFKHDHTECEVEATQAGYRMGLPRRNFLQECMEGRGWTRD